MAHGGKNKGYVKPKEGKKTFLRLAAYLGDSKGKLSVVMVLVVISIACSLLGSYMLRPIINDYIMPGDIPGLLRMLVILAGIYLAGVVAAFIQYRMLNRIGQKTAARLRMELFTKMETLPVKYFDTHPHGDLMSRYTNDMDRISEVLTDNLADMISAVLSLTGILVLMLIISPLLTLSMFIIVPVMLLFVNIIAKRSRKYFTAQQNTIGDVNGYIEEMISGQKVIKIFGQEKKVEGEFDVRNKTLYEKSRKAQLFSGMMMPIMQNFNTLNFVVVTIVGALLAIYRGFDVGGLAAFLQYSRQFGRPITDIASLYNNIQSAIAGAERVFDILDQPSEPADPKDAVHLVINEVKGDICLTGVWFSYDPEKPVLKNISLHARPGERIGLVGSTGAGKTTILNLLPRFYDIDKGDITIDGIPIKNIVRRDLRSSLAIVLQDTHLFTGTVTENIRFGKPKATREDVIEAAKLTSAHSFIKRLPQGYETILENDGENLSQGQRQLLNIARAAVSDPAILLLDEATSNIDTRSETLIQEGLDKLMEGRTSFVIAHRLSTVRNLDRILVLENGEIAEEGSHTQLMEKQGIYYHLYRNQFA
ncbi:MAG: ABC transporter ATP-binding protein/permease [Bacteroidales bacterium]|jgi:ATP-binding cassette subfamily B protein|nr:ABC transporter ATP-binding protein/permease [Bacteroidales bacterium]